MEHVLWYNRQIVLDPEYVNMRLGKGVCSPSHTICCPASLAGFSIPRVRLRTQFKIPMFGSNWRSWIRRAIVLNDAYGSLYMEDPQVPSLMCHFCRSQPQDHIL